MKNKKILHPTKRFKGAEPEDLTIRIDLEKEEQLLREGDRTIILDIAELYHKERNESTKYKLYGKSNMIFRNLYSGTTTYDTLKNTLYDLGDGVDADWTGYLPYNEFAFIRTDTHREVSSPTGLLPGEFTPNITITGVTDHTTITELESASWNWNLFVTYVYDQDETYPMRYTLSGDTVYDFTASNGVPFRVEEVDNYYQLTSPFKHNMSQGEYVILSGNTINSGGEEDRIFSINSVGNEMYESEKYVINLSKSEFTSSQLISGVVFGKRCIDKTNINKTTSTYYVHKHKTLTTVDDCIIDKTGFETPIFEIERKLQFETADGRSDVYVEQNRPETIIYHFKNAIDINGLSNNLGYTPTEVYLTTLFRNRNGYFNYPPRMGWRFNFHNTWVDEQFNDTFPSSDTNLPFTTITKNGINFKQGDELPLGSILIGAFVEYNAVDFKEVVLSETFHKITNPLNVFDHDQTDITKFSGVSANNPSGLFYQTHYKIKLRELSPYIETSNTDDIMNLPENTVYDDFISLWKWRDLYDHGYIDVDGYGTDFPFTNGQHYVKKDITFLLRNEEMFANKRNGIKAFTNDPNKFC